MSSCPMAELGQSNSGSTFREPGHPSIHGFPPFSSPWILRRDFRRSWSGVLHPRSIWHSRTSGAGTGGFSFHAEKWESCVEDLFQSLAVCQQKLKLKHKHKHKEILQYRHVQVCALYL